MLDTSAVTTEGEATTPEKKKKKKRKKTDEDAVESSEVATEANIEVCSFLKYKNPRIQGFIFQIKQEKKKKKKKDKSREVEEEEV